MNRMEYLSKAQMTRSIREQACLLSDQVGFCRFLIIFCQVAEMAIVASFPAAVYQLVGLSIPCEELSHVYHRSIKAYIDHHDGSSFKVKQRQQYKSVTFP